MGTVAKIVLGIIIAFILIVGGCAALVGGAMESASTNSEVTEVEESPSGKKSEKKGSEKATEESGDVVVLRVTGKGTTRASITYADPNMEMTQETNARLPWTKKFKVDDVGILGFSITAQNNNGSGSISCSIREGSETLSENTSKGGYAVVTCN